jgi:hypothetical protein
MQMGKTTFKVCRLISLAADDAQWVLFFALKA